MDTYTQNQARERFLKIIDHASEENYRSLIETVYISSIPGMKDSILSANQDPIDTFVDEIDWKNGHIMNKRG